MATTSGGSQPVAQFKFSLWAKFPSSSKLGQFAVQFPSLRLQPHVPAPCLRHMSQPICPALCPSLQSQPSVQVCPLSQPFVSALCPSPSAQLICHILVSQPSVPTICPSHPCLRLQTLVPALCLRLTLVPSSQPIRPAHCPSLLSSTLSQPAICPSHLSQFQAAAHCPKPLYQPFAPANSSSSLSQPFVPGSVVSRTSHILPSQQTKPKPVKEVAPHIPPSLANCLAMKPSALHGAGFKNSPAVQVIEPDRPAKQQAQHERLATAAEHQRGA